MKWLSFAAALAVIASCFFPWVTIESKHIVVSGVQAAGTAYGKPGYFHILFTIPFLLFLLINTVWSKRINLVLGAINIGWALRNYLILTVCQMGECPVKHPAIYWLVMASVLMLLADLLATPKDSVLLKKD